MKPRRLLWLLTPTGVAALEAWQRTTSPPLTPLQTVLLLSTPLVLLARRRCPLVVFLGTLPDTCTVSGLPSLLALYTVALTNSRRAVAVGCALAFVLAFEYYADANDFRHAFHGEVWELFLLAACVAAPTALGLLARTRLVLSARLHDLERSRHREDQLLAQQVQSAERARLAREMHDIVAHNVSLISLRTAALQVSTTDPQIKSTARELRNLAARTLDELREMVGLLRASGGTSAPQPRLVDLPRLIAESQLPVETRFDIPLADPPASPWPGPVQQAIYRTVQESLTNVRKHAPGTRVHIHLYLADQHVHVDVRNGPPAPEAPPLLLPSGGHGLRGLHERAHLTGGALDAHPTEGGGFHVHAVFPIARSTRAEALPRPASETSVDSTRLLNCDVP